MAPNPFAYVPSLYTAACDIAISVSGGLQVIVLTGPYSIDELAAEVSSLLGKSDLQPDRVDTSVDLIINGKSGLIYVRTLGESYSEFVGRCNSGGAHLITLPVGLSQSELYGYGLALMSGVHSETYRSLVLDLAAGLCGGSVDCYAHVVQEYARHEGATFPNPLTLIRAYGATKLAQVNSWRSYAKDEITAFISFMGDLSRGKATSDADVQATYLWAWSRGFCLRLDGVWYPTWSVIQCATKFDSSEFGGVANLMVCTELRRVGIAEERAMKPVIGQYCGCAVARYLAKATPNETEELSRASQISEIMQFAKQRGSDWNDRLGDSVDMSELYGLRCSLNHLSPEDVSRDKWGNRSNGKLASFSRALSVLGKLEAAPYAVTNSSVFL